MFYSVLFVKVGGDSLALVKSAIFVVTCSKKPEMPCKEDKSGIKGFNKVKSLMNDISLIGDILNATSCMAVLRL